MTDMSSKDDITVLTFNKKPWERQKGETDKGFEAWCCYRDLPADTRTYLSVSKKLKKNLKTISQWGMRNHWQVRISAWQDFLDGKAVEAKLKAIEKMHEEDRKRERDLGLNIIGKVAERFLEKDAKGKGKLKVPDGQVPLWAKTGVELIRISDGLSTTNSNVTVGGSADGNPIKFEVSNLSEEELNRKVREIMLRNDQCKLNP